MVNARPLPKSIINDLNRSDSSKTGCAHRAIMEIIFDMHLMSTHNLKDNLVSESVETLNLRMG